jgi:hypothetical protein
MSKAVRRGVSEDMYSKGVLTKGPPIRSSYDHPPITEHILDADACVDRQGRML